MKIKHRTLTIDVCKAEALKYDTRINWHRKDQSSYQAARKNKWLDICCGHMRKQPEWTLSLCKESAKLYKTRTEWSRNRKGAYKAASKKRLDEDVLCTHGKKVEMDPECLQEERQQIFHAYCLEGWRHSEISIRCKA